MNKTVVITVLDIEAFFTTTMIKQNKQVVKQVIQKLKVLNENTDYSHIDDEYSDEDGDEE